jgi:hypothetical protein
MSDPIALLRALPMEVFETPQPGDAWARSPLATAGDNVLIRTVAASIAPPKAEINSSFLLHAPLELLARASLLPHIAPCRRDDARRRIAEIAARYAAAGPEIESKPTAYATADAAVSALSMALRCGDADAVDGALLFVTPRIAIERVRRALAEPILPLLGAAGHAPVLLMLLQSAAARFPECGALLRSPLRALALDAGRRLTWMEAAGEPDGWAPALFDCLAAPSRVETPSNSIAATMLAVERDGYATRTLAAATGGVTVATARRSLLRVAALSMLLDDPVSAAYGWTHCFTLPQAILSLEDVVSDATRVVRVAATYSLGFRATLGNVRLQYPFAPERRPEGAPLQREPAAAAAAVFHARALVGVVSGSKHGQILAYRFVPLRHHARVIPSAWIGYLRRLGRHHQRSGRTEHFAQCANDRDRPANSPADSTQRGMNHHGHVRSQPKIEQVSMK